MLYSRNVQCTQFPPDNAGLSAGNIDHELGNIRRGEWYSEIRDGERFYFLGSRSDKTHAGKTSWLCPEIAIQAVKVLERLSEPLQDELEQVLQEAKAAGDLKEVTRLQHCSGCIGLTKVPGTG